MTRPSSGFAALDDPARPLLIDGQGVITAGEFASGVRAIAARIDAETAVDAPLLLLCRGRGNFLAALCAALDRGRLILLPHDDTPMSRDGLAARYDNLVCLADSPQYGFQGRLLRVPLQDEMACAGAQLQPDAEPPLLQFFTSGSTGAPVAHGHCWAALAQGGLVWRQILELEGNSGIVATVPPQHMYGMEVSVVLPLTCPGIVLWNGQPLYPADIRAALEAVDGLRVLATTPVHLNALLRSGIRLPPLHRIICATAPLTSALARRAEALWQAPVVDVYGSTETCMVATRLPARGEVWRPRADVSLTFGIEASVARGPHLDGPVRLADRLVPVAGGFRLQRRSDDLVNVAGKRASLAELNAILQQLPGVDDGAFWVPDDSDPESFGRPIAFVVSAQFDAEAVRRELRGRIADVFIPRRVVSVDALPRNATGKLPRAALDRLWRQHVGSRADDA